MSAQNVFKSFTGDQPEMDGRTFVKFCKDSGLFDKVMTQTDADLIFTKIKGKGARKITFVEFEAGLAAIAEKKKISVDELKEKIASSAGPMYKGTVADEVRFHDDKSTYTGVHQHGGPTTTDEGRVQFNDLSQICDRGTANIRGVNSKVMNQKTGDSK